MNNPVPIYSSDAWREISAQLQKELQKLIIELMCNIEHERSIFIRGRIAQIREMLEADKEKFKTITIKPFL